MGHSGAADAYKNIRGYAKNLHDAFKLLGSGLTVVNPDHEVFSVIMDKDEVLTWIADLGKDCQGIAGVVGIHFVGGTPKITISLLGVDDKNHVLQGHIKGDLPGQEVWPEMLTLSARESFLPPPSP